jgi:phosphoglycerate dehydrogenase-like enzyme
VKLNVHLLRQSTDAAALDRLRSELHSRVHLTHGPEMPEDADCHLLIAGRPQRKHLVANPNLQALIIPWAGLPEPTRQLMLEYPHIAVHNLHHNAQPVAEQVLALLLAAAKFIVPMDRGLRSHDWSRRYEPNPSVLLAGKTALILGYGAIGRKVALLCRGLGMKVVAIRRSAEGAHAGGAEGVRVTTMEALHEFLPQANALLICLPHTPETTGILGSRELALLPPKAVLVNVGRGPIVDEAALYHALRDGTLYAAGLDVWYNYPPDEASRSLTLPSAYPFHELDNVVMSPHRAGGSDETEMLRMDHLAEMLNAAARGEAMPNRVSLEVGY